MRPLNGITVTALLFALNLLCGVALATDGSAPPASLRASDWALRAPQDVQAPAIKDASWPRNSIDRFILARLEERSIKASPEAPRARLIRRAYLDLIGTPPTPGEVEAFDKDASTDAFEKVINTLLASPHYGERWARHWLDLARYAESEGFKADETRPNAWRYRDYVIQSLNADKPYDRFVKEQIAGDELWPDDPQARVATAFSRHYPDESNARNLFQRRQEILNDITDTAGSVFLGLTIGCARCHDHKYDPITQRDYYSFQAFFANLRADDAIPMVTPDALREYQSKLANWEEKTKEIREKMAAIEKPRRDVIIRDYAEKYPAEVQTALAKPPAQRTPMDWLLYYKSGQYLLPGSHAYIAPAGAVVGAMKGEEKKQWEALKKELDAFKEMKPADLPLGVGMTDASPEAPPSYVLRGGKYDSPKDGVEPAFLSVIEPKPPVISTAANPQTTGRRAALANWIADPANPLTARVMVNRLWHHHFGHGIAGSPSDFGQTGERPTHPKLLDWLAKEFLRSGWSMKSMHRLIMTSAAYRQDSRPVQQTDPHAQLLSRYPRHRLEAEAIRDSSLAVAGLLNEKVGGPSVFPEVPTGMESRGGWKASGDVAERNRRSVYVFVRRNTRYPMFETLDMPDTHESCSRRNVTTSPLQALTLMNSRLSLEWAQGFAAQVLSEGGASADKQIQAACRRAFGRAASKDESEMMGKFLQQQAKVLMERQAAGKKLAVPNSKPAEMSDAEAAALVDLCQMILNANEFVYVE